MKLVRMFVMTAIVLSIAASSFAMKQDMMMKQPMMKDGMMMMMMAPNGMMMPMMMKNGMMMPMMMKDGEMMPMDKPMMGKMMK